MHEGQPGMRAESLNAEGRVDILLFEAIMRGGAWHGGDIYAYMGWGAWGGDISS